MKIRFNAYSLFLFGLSMSIADHHKEQKLKESPLIRDSWVRNQTLAEGGIMVWKKKIFHHRKGKQL